MGTDKQLVKERFEASFGRYNRLAIVQQRICAELAGRMEEYGIGVPGLKGGGVRRAFEIGAGTGFFTSHIVRMFPAAEWTINDIAPGAEKYVARYARDNRAAYLWGDAEEVAFPRELDLIASASTIQWFDDLAAFISKAFAATSTGGWLVLSTFGPDNFREIRTTTGEGLGYPSAEEVKQMAEAAGYEVVHLEEYTESLVFPTPVDVLRHIKATGVNSLSKTRWSRGRLARFSEDYTGEFATTGGVTLTYHPVLLIARKP